MFYLLMTIVSNACLYNLSGRTFTRIIGNSFCQWFHVSLCANGLSKLHYSVFLQAILQFLNIFLGSMLQDLPFSPSVTLHCFSKELWFDHICKLSLHSYQHQSFYLLLPRITAFPPVIYSHPWSPIPSTIAV